MSGKFRIRASVVESLERPLVKLDGGLSAIWGGFAAFETECAFRTRPFLPLASCCSRPRTLAARLGRLALKLTPSDAKMLDVIGRHPFLPLHGLAIVLGWLAIASLLLAIVTRRLGAR